MTERDGLSDSDQRKLQKAEDDLRRLDPDGQFNKAKTQVQKTVNELQRNLGQIYTQDSDQKDLIRIIRQHLTFYNSALSKLN
jgi:regulator of sirC expression with transglutaminase-like and TPR domain